MTFHQRDEKTHVFMKHDRKPEELKDSFLEAPHKPSRRQREREALLQAHAQWKTQQRSSTSAAPDLEPQHGSPEQSVEIRAMPLSTDLSGQHFRLAHLPQADFHDALLRGANFDEADLRGANFQNANLRNTRFRRANLAWTNFQNADLYWSDLQYANLRGADLRYANLRGANLYRANLSEADLTHADLSWADLREAEIKNAILSETELSGTDMPSISPPTSSGPQDRELDIPFSSSST